MMIFSWLDGFGGRTSAGYDRPRRRLISFGGPMYDVPSQSKGVEVRQVRHRRGSVSVFDGV